MYSEIGFIFSPALKLDNSDNTSNIYGRPIRIKPPLDNSKTNNSNLAENPEEGILVYKNPSASGTNEVRNYIKENVYRNDESDEDPYISLITYFNGVNNRSMILRAADFAYLKDLGVYPINRLWILRRYPDNCIVPNNLLEWGKGVSPISTVIGWIKDREDNPFLSVSFNEVWTDQNQMIDKVLTEILQDEFGLKLPMMMSVPGWSQGILFGMLNSMELTKEFDAYNVPTGDPNVLRTGKMRDIMNQGLNSNLGVTLETTYEQKYINGIDPGMAFLDIITNLTKMGTSDQKFILGKSDALKQFLVNVNKTGYDQAGGWIDLATKLVEAFLKGVTDFVDDLSNNVSDTTTEESSEGNINDDQENRTNSGLPIPSTNIINTFSSSIRALGESIIAGSVSKYRWPLKGSIALMSGINTTPWHLTIGNPYSPILNIGNIVVRTSDLKFSNDLGFNDMPIRIDASFTVELGRPLGKQEIEKMFNNGYRRVYSSKYRSDLSPEPSLSSSSLSTSSGELTPYSGTVKGYNSSYFDPELAGTQVGYNVYRADFGLDNQSNKSIEP